MAATSFRLLHADRYADWQPIGSGGCADVYRVFDRDLGVPLAVKILKPAFCRDASQLDMLKREVLISRALRHPNICPIHDLYEGAQGVGILMDLLQGCDLKQWMADHRGHLLATLGQRITLLHRLAEALVVAHSRIVHRDLKPANIFLAGGDIARPLIMDFGLSVLGDAREATSVGGTPRYMAPEQYAAPARVDARSDLFSLGVLAYELLTDGQLPETSLREVLRTRALPVVPAQGVTPPSTFCQSLPAALDRLVLQLVQLDQDSRPRSAAEVVEVLAGIDLDAALAAPPAPGRQGARDVVRVPAGTYTIGSRRTSAPAAERPARCVRLSAFDIDAHPVTNARFRAFAGATGYSLPPLADDPVFGVADAPVVAVTWEAAAAFAAWSGGRLPTEAEWEVAAKAGADELTFPWGDEAPGPTHANIDRVSDAPSRVGSHPAGRNAWGLWDLCGNVWEWCADPWDEALHRRAEGDALDPVGQGDGSLRPLRGGSFDSFSETGRCSFRARAPADEVRADIGFRVVYAPEEGQRDG
ncbi:bifunctional serine/threonine-protein kinase/formylglycine-generating enzyme family protein [Zavarzinia sp. CC-PAN008]|uniref:bifunctional serine/threonine-protein kinase/formylglycine-generating enzyme family protein n=1 Tax=Zavarzinia sp. CC-PAN008 TaxID=3243332 RepID=UPI003F74895F